MWSRLRRLPLVQTPLCCLPSENRLVVFYLSPFLCNDHFLTHTHTHTYLTLSSQARNKVPTYEATSIINLKPPPCAAIHHLHLKIAIFFFNILFFLLRFDCCCFFFSNFWFWLFFFNGDKKHKESVSCFTAPSSPSHSTSCS